MKSMFIRALVVSTLTLTAYTQHGGVPRCLQMFQQSFRQCFQDTVQLEVDSVYSLVTNETSGPLPPHLEPQTQNMISRVCRNKQAIFNCLGLLLTQNDRSCSQGDSVLREGIVNAMTLGIAGLCRERGHTPTHETETEN